MRIVIDLQGAQTRSRFRGIGRSALSLAKAIVKNKGSHEVIIALSELFPDTIEPIRAAFEGLLPQEKICIWSAPGPVWWDEPSNTQRRKRAELIREAFLASLQPDMILVCSLFEGFIDDAVSSIGKFDTQSKTAVILHDLIPLVHPEDYLVDKNYCNYHAAKVDSLSKADHLLSVSASSKKECVRELSFKASNITTIFAGVDERFKPVELTLKQQQDLKNRYNIARKIVMCAPGGFDSRKNLNGLIKAYAMLPKTLREQHQLVIVSKITDFHKVGLTRFAKQAGLKNDELVLTGYVPDEDLIALYSTATLFVFPSKHEGFGFPPLEAMACGAPTIGSNTTSIPEVIGNKEALFNPESIESITNKMQQALQDASFRQSLKERGLARKEKFCWDNSAKTAIKVFEKITSIKVSKEISGSNKVSELVTKIAEIQVNIRSDIKSKTKPTDKILFALAASIDSNVKSVQGIMRKGYSS